MQDNSNGKKQKDLTLSNLESYDPTPNAEVLPCYTLWGRKQNEMIFLVSLFVLNYELTIYK